MSTESPRPAESPVVDALEQLARKLEQHVAGYHASLAAAQAEPETPEGRAARAQLAGIALGLTTAVHETRYAIAWQRWLVDKVLPGEPEPDDDEAGDETLGPCGCTDYHLADCPRVTGRFGDEPAEPDLDDRDAWREHDDEPLDQDGEPTDCLGHPAGPFDPMGATVYCDGACR